MMVGYTYIYCSVRFNGEKTYWYRTNSYEFRVGMQVIVPVSNHGLWKIGTIVETREVTLENVPYPLLRTKGIVEMADPYADAKVRAHNQQIEQSQYPPFDISIAVVIAGNRKITYCTCARERALQRRLCAINKRPYLLIENYPVARESEIPREALQRLNARLQRLNRP